MNMIVSRTDFNTASGDPEWGRLVYLHEENSLVRDHSRIPSIIFHVGSEN